MAGEHRVQRGDAGLHRFGHVRRVHPDCPTVQRQPASDMQRKRELDEQRGGVPLRVLGGSCGGACVPGTMQCSSNTPQTCDSNGAWQGTTPCSGVCIGSGVCADCTPGAKRCNVNQPQLCDGTGHFADNGAACPFVCSGGDCSGVCTPGAVQCAGDVPQVCNGSGSWVDGTTCEFGMHLRRMQRAGRRMIGR